MFLVAHAIFVRTMHRCGVDRMQLIGCSTEPRMRTYVWFVRGPQVPASAVPIVSRCTCHPSVVVSSSKWQSAVARICVAAPTSFKVQLAAVGWARTKELELLATILLRQPKFRATPHFSSPIHTTNAHQHSDLLQSSVSTRVSRPPFAWTSTSDSRVKASRLVRKHSQPLQGLCM